MTLDDPSIFVEEIATYDRRLPDLKFGHLGRYALIKGNVLAIFDTHAEAIKAGHDRYGLGQFMVREIGQKPIFMPYFTLADPA